MMKIVEFNGLPGCGKTTISRELYHLLEQTGNAAVFYNDVRRKCSGWKGILQSVLGWNFGEIINLYKISRCFEKIPFKQKWGRILYAEQIAYNYRRILDGASVCVADQGLIQAIVSIGYIHDFKSAAKSNDFVHCVVEFLKPYSGKVLFVNTQIDSKASCERLQGREQNSGRFDSLSEEKLLYGMAKQEKIFQLIWDKCLEGELQTVTISSHDLPAENARKIVIFCANKREDECE